jgi:transposase
LIGLGEIVLIHDLKRQGLGVSAIARQTGLDRKTVRKYLTRGLEAPEYKARPPRARIIEPYEAYLQDVNAEVKFPRSAEVIFPTFGIW